MSAEQTMKDNTNDENKVVQENLSESLDSIALNNLSLLVKEEKNSFINNRFILQKNKMIENEDDNIDVVYSLNDLENSIYFTFNQCIGILSKDETDKYVMLHSLFSALDVVEEYYNERKDTSLHLENILDDIEFKLMNHRNKYYNKSICTKFIKEAGNKLHDFLMECSREVFQFYWHYHSFDSFSDFSDDDGDKDSDNESVNRSDNDSENESDNDLDNESIKDKEC